MNLSKEKINYGPLSHLIGVWSGDKGLDVSPEPDGSENNEYYETLTFTEAGDVTNAESQLLSVLYYRQTVQRTSNDEVFHDETGYWMWDEKTDVVMHSLTIPRGVCVLAGGKYDQSTDEQSVELEVSAAHDDKKWGIIQSPFMQENALTTDFYHRINVEGNSLSYTETMMINIYGKVFKHTDQNVLTRK